MRRLLLALVLALLLFGGVTPSMADTYSNNWEYQIVTREQYTRMALENESWDSVKIRIEDGRRFNIAAYYEFDVFVCSGGYYGGGSCHSYYAGSGYFCRNIELTVPDAGYYGRANRIKVTVIDYGTYLYCGTLGLPTRGNMYFEWTSTFSSGGGGCSLPKSYMPSRAPGMRDLHPAGGSLAQPATAESLLRPATTLDL